MSGARAAEHPAATPGVERLSEALASMDERLVLIAELEPSPGLAALGAALDADGDVVVLGVFDSAASVAGIRAMLDETARLRAASYRELRELASPLHGGDEATDPAALHATFFGRDEALPRRRFDRAQRMVIVADEFPESARRALGWASLLRVDVDAFRPTDAEEGGGPGERVWSPADRWRFLVGWRARTVGDLWREPMVDLGEKELPPLALSVQRRVRGAFARLEALGVREAWLANGSVLLMMLAYTLVFSRLLFRQHAGYGTQAFDFGIYDQAVWLLSRGLRPFSTIMGMNVFGDHVSPLLLLLAPLYRLWADARLLLVVQTAALALGALPVYLFAKEKLGGMWSAVAVAACYLLYPALEWVGSGGFHPEALAVPAILFAFLFLYRRKWLWFAVFALLALATKEEAAFAVVALGSFAVVAGHRKVGAATIIGGLAWLFVALGVVVPHFGPNGPAHFVRDFAYLGSAGGGALLAGKVFSAESGAYVLKLLGPVALLPLAAPAAALIALPGLLVNLASGDAYHRSIEFQHTALVIPFVFIAVVYGLSRLSRNAYSRTLVLAVMLGAAVAGNYLLSPSPLAPRASQGLWRQASDRSAVVDRAMAMIPPDAVVSANYTFVPHLTHRTSVYVFPMPFKVENWGLTGEDAPSAGSVEYVLVDYNNAEADQLALAMHLKDQDFTQVFHDDGIVLLKRNH